MNVQEKATSLAAIADALKAAGGQAALANAIDRSQAHISRLKDGYRIIDALDAVKIERAYKIPRWRFRPDAYDAPKKARKK